MKFLMLALFCLLFLHGFSKPVLPDFFSDGMMLQQKTEVKLWGTATANSKISVSVSWSNEVYTSNTDSNGSFSLFIATPAASFTHHHLNISDKDGTVQINNVLIGEVWLCSGQSNMQMPVKGFVSQPVLDAEEILLESKNDAIRILKIPINKSAMTLTNIKNIKWEAASPVSVKETSAVAYLYAKRLNKVLDVPVGIIVSSVGGTKIQAWMSKASLTDFYRNSNIIPKEDQELTSNNTPTVLYNAMIHPLVGYSIKGVIWYQGEGNRLEFTIYDSLMHRMVTDWRKQWNIGEWPFYYVQIAPWKYKESESSAVPKLREAQERAMSLIPNSGMACIIDAGVAQTIHPPDKSIVANRLSLWALAKTYRIDGLQYMSPAYQSHTVKNDTVIVKFANTENGLTSFYKPITSFELAGKDGIFYSANAELLYKPKSVRLLSGQVKKPVYIRYAFKDWTVGSLYNTEGLPVLPFRTDTQ